METRWADAGFLGSLVLALYGFLSFVAYYLPFTFIGAVEASAFGMLLGVLAGVGGFLSSLGLVAYVKELDIGGVWLLFLAGLVSWELQCASLLLIAARVAAGLIWYIGSTAALALTFLLWGLTLISYRRKFGRKERTALFTGLVLLFNGPAWFSHFGFAGLSLIGLLSAVLLAPSTPYSPFYPVVRLFSAGRIHTLGQLGIASLSLYSLLSMRWLVNQFFPLPVAAAVLLNVTSLLLGWLAVLGTAIVFTEYKFSYENRLIDYALAVGIPSVLFLSLADFVWLMSNLTVSVDSAWGLLLYGTVELFWGWTALPLCVWALLAAFGFLMMRRAPEGKGDRWLLLLHFTFLVSGLLWLFGLGYMPLILAGLLFLLHSKRQGAKPTSPR